MTDQSKIPVPHGDAAATSIERAVEALGWGRFAAPPVALDPQTLTSKRASDAEGLPAVAEPQAPARPPIKATPLPTALRSASIAADAVAIDREHLRRQGFIIPDGPVTGLLEEFRIIKRQLLLQVAELRGDAAGGRAQRLLICSPHSGEGKTYCAVNLALAIAAEKESEVLLIDADFAKPSIPSAFGLPAGRGLMDALADPAIDVAELVIDTDIAGLKILPAGSTTNSDSEYLSSSRTSGVLDRLTQDAPHRVVIFDSPPALAATPASELAKYVGQAVVICRADQTGQGALEDAISLLSGCPNIQLLLNAVDFSPSGRRFGTYYGHES